MNCCDDAILVTVENNKVILPCGKRLTLYKLISPKKLVINPLFEELRIDLWWTKPFQDTNAARTTLETFYKLPKTSATSLTSVSRDPSGACLWTITSGIDGPVTNADNAVLNTPINLINYKFKWTLTEPTTISFYSEIVDNTVVPAIDIHGRLAIFDGHSLTGEFTTFDYFEFVITTNNDVGVTLYVEAMIPEIPYEYVVPSTKYLEFEYECKRYKFPVYKLRYGPELVDVIVDRSLLELEALVKSSIMSLGLEIPPIPEPLVALTSTDVITVVPNTLFLGKTISLGGGPILFWNGYYITTYDPDTRPVSSLTGILTEYSYVSYYMSPLIYPGNQYRNRYVTYNISIAAQATDIGKTYAVSCMRSRALGVIISQLRDNKPIFDRYTYKGAETISGTFRLGDRVSQCIIKVSFEKTNETDGFVKINFISYYAEI